LAVGSLLAKAILILVSPRMLFLVVAGVAAGIVVGALPGLSVTMAVALLTSLTFGWDIQSALVLMISIWVGGCYGGSKSAVLLNIPGAPAAVATGFDGYPLARLGEAAFGMGVATVASCLGGLFGTGVLAVAAPAIAEIGLKFGPPEYFLLVMWGLTTVGSLSAKSLSKGLLSACLGLAVSMVGLDTMYGTGRFTFGSIELAGGIHFVPALIGVFGLSEVLLHLEKRRVKTVAERIGADTFKRYLSAFAKHVPLTLRCAVIGTIIGAIPGIGGEIASLVAYDHAKRTVKRPTRQFGEGAYEGVLAPETANNAAIGGALIPLLTLGVPGDAVTAVILGVLYIHGIRPGPLVFNQDRLFFAVIVLVCALAHIVMLWLGFAGNRWLARVVTVPLPVLMPIVVLLSVVGSFAVQNRIFDVYLMVAFGLAGYLLKKADFPVGPVILGVILGPMADGELRRTLALYEGDVLRAFVTRPISLVLAVLVGFTVLSQSETAKAIVLRFRLGFSGRPARPG
jgi:putative tricarboxylic transport membrane protein